MIILRWTTEIELQVFVQRSLQHANSPAHCRLSLLKCRRKDYFFLCRSSTDVAAKADVGFDPYQLDIEGA